VVDEFYAAGRGDFNYLNAYLARARLTTSQFPIAAEYGCGVGRVTRWLAPQFSSVRAFDISAPHMYMAKEYLLKEGIANVDFVHVGKRDDLRSLNGIDLFFSMIVLQHNPPPIIIDILDHAFHALNPGGIAFFQVPTYSSDYSFNASDYWADVASKKEMEIHFVPQVDILNLAHRHGLVPLEIREDHCIGSYERQVSSTFLMQKVRV
jgi:SAM-dependent methyltransferase